MYFNNIMKVLENKNHQKYNISYFILKKTNFS